MSEPAAPYHASTGGAARPLRFRVWDGERITDVYVKTEFRV